MVLQTLKNKKILGSSAKFHVIYINQHLLQKIPLFEGKKEGGRERVRKKEKEKKREIIENTVSSTV